MAKDSNDKPYISDDPEQVKQANSKAKIAALRDVEDIKFLMKTEQFRRYVWKLLARTHIYSTSFTGNSETFYREGERNIGLYIFATIQKECPDEYALMAKENA